MNRNIGSIRSDTPVDSLTKADELVVLNQQHKELVSLLCDKIDITNSLLQKMLDNMVVK